VIILVIGGIILTCPIKTIQVEGVQYYSKADIISAVKADYYIPNSVFLKLRNAWFPIETMPFVENISIQIDQPTSITIKVHENLRAGCISYAGKYVYFDKDGYALEVMDERLKDVPLVTGLSYDNITISEKLPVKKKGYFSKIIKITTLITKNELLIDEIQFKKDGDILLKKGDITVNLGSGDNLDIQLDVLSGVFTSLKGKKGTVYMDQYTKENKIITFRVKK
jgi:cell division protein FtsQ